jgi:hypothetical protein
MPDKKKRHEEANAPGTGAAPMRDDTTMSTHDTKEMAAADTVAEDVGGRDSADSGFLHAPLSGAGQAGTGSGSYAVIGGANIGGRAGLYPADIGPDVDPNVNPDTVADDVKPELRGMQAGPDQDLYDPNDRDVLERAE